MIKQRFLGLALSLALLGSFAFATTASAITDPDENVVITVTVVDTLILSLNHNTVAFGSNLDFLGNGAGSGITPCVGVGTTRYVSPTITATVWSNASYDIDRSLAGSTGNVAELAGRGFIGSGAFVDCTGAVGTPILGPNTNMVSNQAAASGAQHSEFYMIDVNLGSPDNAYSLTIKYTASAS